MPIVFQGWRTPGGIVAIPGYSIFDTPWAGIKASVGAFTRTQNSANLSGGNTYTGGADADEWTQDHYLPSGTLKWAGLYITNTDAGILSMQFDGVEKGTVDQYSAALTRNVYSEITGITKTASLTVVKHKASGKNASSSAYYIYDQTYALIRTGA